ncbi:hypothetical protein PFICI_03712 [Pestalotiopsis fici W106-1]|uniref:Uncharacterized protein n=1 Tax=Pestalotiopsis fici (strain W106-1 / CGMCC3.15140) TaxID=1229662 RepID=W3XJN0_PESFW|nr:uncharacterized protein PFICI_03712 [Pestalotiopsis fici W106-1]ETS85687.1 hypothetical protein PFICI_03712 [Pestalotiopsis fici W106-1]
MATNETLASSLSFMTDAAHLIAQTAPETSAYLMSQRNGLMFHSDLQQTDAQRQRVCGSCGHIMVLGSGDLLKVESDKTLRAKRSRRRREDKPPSSSEGTKHKILTCANCGSYTDINVPAAPSLLRNRIKLRQAARKKTEPPKRENLPVTHFPPPVITEPTSNAVSANASSKKRAKNRKQGLQALLQQSQSSSAKSGFGLSLTDFMKK